MKNPKQKLKNILLLFTALLIVSCSKDNYEDLSLKENNFKINHVKFKDLKTAENKDLAKSVNSLISYQKSSKTNKLVYNETYDFYIDEENGIYVSIDGKESYTFPIYKSQSDGTVENLIFNEEENGGFSIILADYSLTKNQLDNLNHAPSEGEVQYYDMSRFDVTELMCIDRYSYEDTGELVGADSQPFYDWILTGSYCWWNQGGGGSLGDTDSSGGNTGGELGDGSGGSGGGGSGGSVVTSPNSGLTIAQYQFLSQLNKLTAGETFYTFDENTYNSILNYVEANNSNTLLISSIAYFLNNTNTLWISNQSTQTQQSIFNYLIADGFSTASKNKINQLINVAIATNTTFTIDPTVNATNGQVFNNANDLEDYLNTGNSSNCTTQVNNINLGERISKAVFDLGIFINLELSVKQNTNPFSVTAVTSEITGMTLGKEWHQTNSTTNNTAGFPNSAEVDVYGNMVHFIFLEGIGTVFTASEHFQIKFLKNNGSIYATIHY